ncbi:MULTISPECIES: hypothetical protein [Prochlorococcus]|uniref:hypothetical protein n=1 Tax=Prochlorococcus TaxID=1218 RepID=UPI000533712A|nr:MULTISPECIES: hypothetical protein [Prochlorococcus]KGG11965.1 NAD(P)H-quinone oxidoreductase NdhF subunit [Prochlorococcus sp. MIT 0601]
MHSLFEASWLIPASPLAISVFIALLLLLFNRTMNRLSKPVTFLSIISILTSTLISLFLLLSHESGIVLDWQADVLNQSLKLHLAVDKSSEVALITVGLIVILLLTTSYFRLPRKTGYVRYVTLVSFASGLIFLSLISSDIPQSLIGGFSLQ